MATLIQKKLEWSRMIKSSPFKEIKKKEFISVPRTKGEFAFPLPYQVGSNSRVWRKRGIGVV